MSERKTAEQWASETANKGCPHTTGIYGTDGGEAHAMANCGECLTDQFRAAQTEARREAYGNVAELVDNELIRTPTTEYAKGVRDTCHVIAAGLRALGEDGDG